MRKEKRTKKQLKTPTKQGYHNSDKDFLDIKREEFVNTVVKENPELCKLDRRGYCTQKLLKMIPEKKLSAFIGIYRFFLECEKKCKERRVYQPILPKREVREINQILEKLETKGWLTSSGVKKIHDCIKEQMFYSPKAKAIDYCCGALMKKVFHSGGRIMGNIALNILISLLVFESKQKTRTCDWLTIAEFLNEQRISNDITEDSVKKRYERLIKSGRELSRIEEAAQVLLQYYHLRLFVLTGNTKGLSQIPPPFLKKFFKPL